MTHLSTAARADNPYSVAIRDLDLDFDGVRVLRSLNLNIHKGEFLVLLGSSGCGKSTLLNCIAGLLDITDGQILINDRDVTWEEPKDRDIAMVFQSYALYPQMTVEKNLSFALKVAGVNKEEIQRRVSKAAEMLHLTPLLQRKPAALSGGQRQRVAIGRALVRDVDVFLFDEPLSNLDAKLRTELRVEIKRLHQQLNNTMIYVTHDQIEALTLADRIAIMKEGVIQQLDTPQTIYNKPVNRFVAGFIGSPGMNFLQGQLQLQDSQPWFIADSALAGLSVPLTHYPFCADLTGSKAVELGVRPEHVVVGEAATALPVCQEVGVEIVEPMGSDTLAWTRLAGQAFSFRTDTELNLKPGDRLLIGFDPARASCFDARSGERI
ncbi:ABC transporter ATP-binding protein [Pokkaliibacter plantistimulans]|uniref:ABC transporter ATP-binding protein n=1 Tax=Pokkaliibacter plantistimulans TaxID=1635171 RepID=A0ABX5LSG3_9GAMM|nr:ABC transporter ATP-binding protein [Pokkaliibacter plantistimulans]PXF29590.1 ABC transporter ATP-binding protein [Pokkaliibacter plantistimulans]